MSRSLNVNVAPGSRSVGLSLVCARPRPVPCTPSNEPGPQTLHAMLRLIVPIGRFSIIELAFCPRCRMTRLRPISWLPRISMGLTIAQLSERLRCAECGGQLQSVKPWRMEDVIGMWGTQDDGPPRRMSPCSEIIGFGSSVGFNLGYCAMHPKQDMGQQIGDRIFRLAVTKAPHGSAWN